MKEKGLFWGIGVGPGEPGLIPLIAWEVLQECDLIFTPRAQRSHFSIARRIVEELGLDEKRFREVAFEMDSDHQVNEIHYQSLAIEISEALKQGHQIAYLTLGDPLTYSTYIYLLRALLKQLPNLEHRTFPGISSFAALAAATDWPLGEGKERILILPCPSNESELEKAIQENDVVVLMKIAENLPWVLELLKKMKIASYCVFGKRVGMAEQKIIRDLSNTDLTNGLGYFSSLLIRKKSS